jgi:hypothetical protein
MTQRKPKKTRKKPIDYAHLMSKSVQQLFHNPIIFLPLLPALGLGLLIGAFILLQIGGSSYFFPNLWSVPSMMYIALFGLLDFMLLLSLQTYIASMYLGIIQPIVRGKKATSKDMWQAGKKYFVNLFYYSIIIFLLFLIPLGALGSIILLLSMLSLVASIITGIFFLLLFIIYIMLLGFSQYFAIPLLAQHNYKALTLVKKSITYFRNNASHVIITWALAITISIGINILILPATIYGEIGTILPLLVGSQILSSIVSFFLQLWGLFFLFNSYAIKK